LYFQRKKDFDTIEAKEFLKITSAGFSAPRKKVISNLANTLQYPKELVQTIFEKLELKGTARAEEIDITIWKQIIRALHEQKNLEK
jgi:16S rRNA A1518/A1519 N6-dimethyltransferase RsmA/KsgA/DIM1 with predicted DNA glycosylase/AP lyase activity